MSHATFKVSQWVPKRGGSHKTILFWKHLFHCGASPLNCYKHACSKSSVLPHQLCRWTGPEIVRQTANPQSDCLSRHRHTCSIMDTSWLHLGGGRREKRTWGDREGWLQPSRAFDSAETKLQPATWIITGQHWASKVRSKPQVRSHRQTHTQSLACKQTAWHSPMAA